MPTLSLDGAWTVTAVPTGQPSPVPADLVDVTVPALVPGCVHLDLLAAGLIAEPFDGDNEAAQQWIGSTDWRYERTFEWSPPGGPGGDGHERHDLVALGLDTLATVELNGTVVATTENQHRSHRWSVGHLLREGENTLAVTFAAPVPAAERRQEENGGELFHVNHHPYNALRKMASSFGWDWGIDVASSGIWRSIGIESWSSARIDSVRPLVEVIGGTGVLHAHVTLTQQGVPRPRPVTVAVSRDGATWTGRGAVTTSGVVDVVVPDVRLWWPRGHGEPDLYDVVVTLADDGDDAAPLDAWRHAIGFRTVEIDTTPDDAGTPFVLRVNGRDVEVRGANWIPDDAFVTRVDRARLERRIADATEANINLLRVWGGGLYESDEFYDLCSRAGLLVWQDFLLACAAYAEEDWLAREIEAEAREAVTRLSKHPSLVLWCGNNENVWGYVEWGWRAQLAGRTWGAGYYFETFPAILAELDPTRPYIPGSPFSPSRLMTPNDPANGTVHIWDVWNAKDYTSYREWRPRFVAEFGFQGPPAWTTLFDVVHDSPADPYGHEMLVHQKANEGNLKLERGYLPHLPAPRTIDDWHLVTQLNQAHAITFGIAWFRSLTPRCTGAVVWQLNDDWPVVSWAAVDYAERRKPLWYALRDVFAPRYATIQPVDVDGTDGARELVVLNDTETPLRLVATARRTRFDGAVLAEESFPLDVSARGHARRTLAEVVMTPADASEEIVVVTFDAADGATAPDGLARVVHDLADAVDQRLDPAAPAASATSTQDGAVVTVTASGYVRDVVVLADRADRSASVDRSLVSLLPGESVTFTLRGDGPIDPAAATDPRVLRSANQLHGDPIGTPLP
ncbi:MAG: beta-mannosidase [Micrococcales bacterium 73-15]|mgnify:CR=1 FL=1|uniref:glycoside hydrolase family 2 protein n=1 Tax=Salana multivorans TaxID=120377 RepID=UPI00095CADE7|nr:glycoside hydrolase family 2 TIM barrel-domain containing protein [Salana multivorans]OJX98163.1 MAG: beta-mannosidase [Micrococcales bacterium 73-15]